MKTSPHLDPWVQLFAFMVVVSGAMAAPRLLASLPQPAAPAAVTAPAASSMPAPAPLPSAGAAWAQPSADSRQAMQHYLSGVIFFQKGDYAKARGEWTAALALDPSNGDAKNGLERLDKLYGQ